MLPVALVLSLLALTSAPRSPAGHVEYTLRVDTADLSGVAVELRMRGAPASLRLAAHAHPEYDDKYWRYVDGMSAVDAAGHAIAVAREDSVHWLLSNAPGDVTVRYRVRFPPEGPPRAAWRPFLTARGGLVGGPHSFLYVVGQEHATASVNLDLPRGWLVATGLDGASTARTFAAKDMLALMESPMLVGALSEWHFTVRNVPHRVFYWRLPDAPAFDSVALVRDIEQIAGQATNLFGGAPYTSYTFLLQDGAYGALEHPNSVTVGVPATELARGVDGAMGEIAHEFFHTWNLMAITPVEYRGIDWRVQPPVAELWFSEGLTMFYADLLQRRAGLRTSDSTRIAHLESLIQRYLSAPGNARFSAEEVSRAAYNASPGTFGDYTASTHLQGELLGTMLDLVIRDATDGRRSMDDVMRVMYARFRHRGFTNDDVRAAVDSVCACHSAWVFDRYVTRAHAIDFAQMLAPIGLSVTTSSAPATDGAGRPQPDLRVAAWQDAGQPWIRLRVADPNSVWARAGLHTSDKVVSVNGVPVRTWPEFRTIVRRAQIGDTVAMVVKRAEGDVETRIVVPGYDRPVVRIEPLPAPTDRQRRLLAQWMRP